MTQSYFYQVYCKPLSFHYLHPWEALFFLSNNESSLIPKAEVKGLKKKIKNKTYSNSNKWDIFTVFYIT
jgi:hypothetical protein